MIGISFWRVIKTALKNFWRNIWLSIATTIIMTITLLMMSFLYFANVFGAQLLTTIQNKVDLSVTFKENVQDQYIQAIAAELRTRPDVSSVRIITSEEALTIFQNKHKQDPLIEESLKELEKNPLPANIYIIATDPQQYENIAKQLQSEKYSPYIETVNFENSRSVINRLISVMQSVKNIGVIGTAIFAALVVLIMFNTIRLAIYSFREEIDIMRLVGASRWFIQGPFVVEAMLVAFFAVALSLLITFPSLKASSPHLESFFFNAQDTPFSIYNYAVSHALIVIGLQAAFGMGLAILSSLVAVRRYLRN